MAKRSGSEVINCTGPYDVLYQPTSNSDNQVALGFHEGHAVSMICRLFDQNDQTCMNVNILGAETDGFEYLACPIFAQLAKKS